MGSVVLLFGAGRGIRTPVPFGQTVFKNFNTLHRKARFFPESSPFIPQKWAFHAHFPDFCEKIAR